MSETHRDDFELATAAEQSSEEDEAQEGSPLAAAEQSEDSAEHQAIHVVDDDEEEGDLAGLLEALDAARRQSGVSRRQLRDYRRQG